MMTRTSKVMACSILSGPQAQAEPEQWTRRLTPCMTSLLQAQPATARRNACQYKKFWVRDGMKRTRLWRKMRTRKPQFAITAPGSARTLMIVLLSQPEILFACQWTTILMTTGRGTMTRHSIHYHHPQRVAR